jgi:hypothetical protein
MGRYAVKVLDLYGIPSTARGHPLQNPVLLAFRSSLMAPPTAAQVYIKQMFKRKHGKPLWFPEVREVYIGDVGFFERETGNFYRLFNVLVEHDDPLNAQGVPDGFKPLPIKPQYVTYAPQTWKFGQCLRTSTVTASELEFKPLE